DLVQPGGDPGLAGVERGQLALHDEKHVVAGVVERVLAHAQAAQAAPDVAKVLLVDLLKAQATGRWRGELGRRQGEAAQQTGGHARSSPRASRSVMESARPLELLHRRRAKGRDTGRRIR